MAPAAALVGAFVIAPFFWIIFVSFTNRTLLGKTAVNPEFVGLDNYIALFDPSNFFTRGQFGFSLILTIQFVLFSAIIGQAVLGLLLAWLMQAVPKPVKSLTETAVIDDPELALANIERLRDAGIEISIDDYGSGLSSLSYL
ncbi:MAG: hypothetical protein ABGW90_15030, partial [Martelella sp.]